MDKDGYRFVTLGAFADLATGDTIDARDVRSTETHRDAPRLEDLAFAAEGTHARICELLLGSSVSGANVVRTRVIRAANSQDSSAVNLWSVAFALRTWLAPSVRLTRMFATAAGSNYLSVTQSIVAVPQDAADWREWFFAASRAEPYEAFATTDPTEAGLQLSPIKMDEIRRIYYDLKQCYSSVGAVDELPDFRIDEDRGGVFYEDSDTGPMVADRVESPYGFSLPANSPIAGTALRANLWLYCIGSWQRSTDGSTWDTGGGAFLRRVPLAKTTDPVTGGERWETSAVPFSMADYGAISRAIGSQPYGEGVLGSASATPQLAFVSVAWRDPATPLSSWHWAPPDAD